MATPKELAVSGGVVLCKAYLRRSEVVRLPVALLCYKFVIFFIFLFTLMQFFCFL